MGDYRMNEVLLDLSQKCRTWLETYPGPAGRQKIAAHLEELLTDQNAINHLVPMTAGERDLLYQDPDLGFCILAHNYPGPKTVPPHDHGPSWAIYAQVRGETEMREYDLVQQATAGTPGKVSVNKTYQMRPGDAYVYDEGVLHAPTRREPTSLLRIEGTDMTQVKRLKYEQI